MFIQQSSSGGGFWFGQTQLRGGGARSGGPRSGGPRSGGALQQLVPRGGGRCRGIIGGVAADVAEHRGRGQWLRRPMVRLACRPRR